MHFTIIKEKTIDHTSNQNLPTLDQDSRGEPSENAKVIEVALYIYNRNHLQSRRFLTV